MHRCHWHTLTPNQERALYCVNIDSECGRHFSCCYTKIADVASQLLMANGHVNEGTMEKLGDITTRSAYCMKNDTAIHLSLDY